MKEFIMKTKLISQEREKTYAVILDDGDEFMEVMEGFAEEQGIKAAHFTAIGGFSRATLGYYDMERRSTRRSQLTSRWKP
jgi:predicted DNA-binding protein with PD1-like motif